MSDLVLRLIFSFLLTAILFSLVLGALSLLASDPVTFAWLVLFVGSWAFLFTGTKVTRR